MRFPEKDECCALATEFVGRGCEGQDMFGASVACEPSGQCVSQNGNTCFRSFAATVDHDDAAEAARTRARDSIDDDSIGGLAAETVEIDTFLRRGLGSGKRK